MTFNRLASSLLGLSLAFMGIGVMLVNNIFLWMALILLCLIFVGYLVEPPHQVNMDVGLSSNSFSLGKICEVLVRVEVKKGWGPVLVFSEIPSSFHLESGSNTHLFWKGTSPLTTYYCYTVKPLQTGRYLAGRLLWRSWDAFGLKAMQEDSILQDMVVEVVPRTASIKKKRNIAMKSRIPLPAETVVSSGAPALEFRELRTYNFGDPMKVINWKATARNVQNGSCYPIVNEFEKEGRKNVWVFLEHSTSMNFGTTARSTWDCALEAVSSLTSFYLGEDIKVGVCTYGRSDFLLHPAAGQQQHQKILRLLMRIKESDALDAHRKAEKTNLQKATIKYKKYFSGQQPLIVVVTRLHPGNFVSFESGLRELFKLAKVHKGKYPVFVVNIGGYGYAVQYDIENIAASFLQARDYLHLSKLRNKVNWVEWNPSKTAFSQAINRLEVQ